MKEEKNISSLMRAMSLITPPLPWRCQSEPDAAYSLRDQFVQTLFMVDRLQLQL
jgi:hypothetical protein